MRTPLPSAAARARRRLFARLVRRTAGRPAGDAGAGPTARLLQVPTASAARAPEPDTDPAYTFGFARASDARGVAALLGAGEDATAGASADAPDTTLDSAPAVAACTTQLDALDADPDADVLIARRGSAVVGAAVVRAHPHGGLHLPAGVHVAPADRGRGVGRRLGHLALAWLAVEGVTTARVPDCVRTPQAPKRNAPTAADAR